MRCDLDFFTQFGSIFKDKWRDHAECIDAPEYVFHEPEYTEQAQQFCEQCPVWAECLDDALYFDDGGYRALSEKERSSITMHRKRNIKAFQYDLGILDE